jgi:hypothetical protein
MSGFIEGEDRNQATLPQTASTARTTRIGQYLR